MKNVTKQILMSALFVLAVCLIAAGVSDGGFADVADKARMICYECIGIG